MSKKEVKEVASKILKDAGISPESLKKDADYAKLLKNISGSAAAMELLLPDLKHRSPGEILSSFKRFKKEGRSVQDAACGHLLTLVNPEARVHLSVLSLFSAYVHIGTLTNFVRLFKPYEEILGQAPEPEAFRSFVAEAAKAGLVRQTGTDIFKLSPVVAGFLRGELTGAVGDESLQRLERGFAVFYASWAGHYFEGVIQGDEAAVSAAGIEEANLRGALALSMDIRDWAAIELITRTLYAFYTATGRGEDWTALRDEVLTVTGRELKRDADTSLANTVIFLIGNEAVDLRNQKKFDQAEAAHRTLLEYLESLDEGDAEEAVASSFNRQQLLAASYNQLGIISLDKGDTEEAEKNLKKSIEIKEQAGMEAESSIDCHYLGMIHQGRDESGEAEKWYLKALEINEKEGRELAVVTDCRHLAAVYQTMDEPDKATESLKKSLEINQRLDLENESAEDACYLGMIAMKKTAFDEAEEWFKKSYEINDRLGLDTEAAAICHHLGMAYEEAKKFEESEKWYKKALKVYEKQEDLRARTRTLAQLGVMNHKNIEHVKALANFGLALAISAKEKMPERDRILFNLAFLIDDMGEESFVNAWRGTFAGNEPPLALIRSAMEILEKGEDPPS